MRRPFVCQIYRIQTLPVVTVSLASPSGGSGRRRPTALLYRAAVQQHVAASLNRPRSPSACALKAEPIEPARSMRLKVLAHHPLEFFERPEELRDYCLVCRRLQRGRSLREELARLTEELVNEETSPIDGRRCGDSKLS